MPEQKFDEKWKDKTIKGDDFPDSPYSSTIKIVLNKEIVEEYIPVLDKEFADLPKGFRLLCIIFAYREGFKKGTRAYNTNNPGNIGNVDSGKNNKQRSLKDGIALQVKFFRDVVAGRIKAYPMNKKPHMPPTFSEEIARNTKNYGISPWLPGYDFIFTGKLKQFLKIYSTASRGTNSGVSKVMSFFRANGLVVHPNTTIQEIMEMK